MARKNYLRLGAVTAAASMVATLSGLGAPAMAATKAAAQPGVTANSITVGNITVLSGPVPGLFAGALNGVKAYFNYVNSKGGVNGRKLLIKSGDDGYSCSTNASLTASQLPSVFAFVGNFSVFDACGAAALAKAPTTADVSYPLDPQTKLLPNVYSPQPGPPGYRTGSFLWVKQHYPKAVLKVGTIYGNATVQSWEQAEGAMVASGYKIAYQEAVTATQTQFTSEIIRMKSAGVQLLYLTDNAVGQQAAFLNQAAQQGWHPLVLLESAYDPNFFKLLTPGAANGALYDSQFAYFGGEDAAAVPEVKLFDTWIKKTVPSFSPDLYAMYSWAAAALFVQALKTLGKNPTQAGLLAALKNIHKFTDNGMLAPADVGRKIPPTCYFIGKVVNNKWVRVAPAKSGFICKPGGYYYQKTSGSASS